MEAEGCGSAGAGGEREGLAGELLRDSARN